MKRKKYIWFLMLGIVLCSSWTRLPLSMAVMSVYSKINENSSAMRKAGIRITMPSGKGWYPFVMVFNPEEMFHQYVQDEAIDLTILYNFPGFSMQKGCSYLYDESSEYYSSFYGAYVVTDSRGIPFGFQNGRIDVNQAVLVPKFDYQMLVLSDFGLSYEDMIFSFRETDRWKEDSGWECVEGRIETNGCAHNPDGFVQSYFQYGVPKFQVEHPFQRIVMRARVYGKYLKEQNSSVFFYLLTPQDSQDVFVQTDHTIIKKSRVYTGKDYQTIGPET